MTKRILVQSDIYRIYDLEGNAIMTIDKGYILFCTESGLEVKLKANSLGDGIKRLVSFFKDLKKLLDKPIFSQTEYMVDALEEIIKKNEIDLGGL